MRLHPCTQAVALVGCWVLAEMTKSNESDMTLMQPQPNNTIVTKSIISNAVTVLPSQQQTCAQWSADTARSHLPSAACVHSCPPNDVGNMFPTLQVPMMNG